MDNFSNELVSVIKNVINQYCDSDGTIKYYMQRDEYGCLNSEEDLTTLANHLSSGVDLPTAASYTFYGLHDDIATDITMQEEDFLYKEIESALSAYDRDNDTDLRSEWDELFSYYDVLEDCGYAGVSFDAEDFFPSTLYLDIELATKEELNHEGFINECFGDYNGEGNPTDPELQDNMLVKFLQSQGFEAIDVFDESKSDKVLNSVRNEIDNIMSNINYVTVCASFGIEDGAKLLSGNYSSITIKPGSTIGLFDTWNGSGSVLDMEMSTPWTVSASDVSEIRISSDSHSGHYCVPDVYGFYTDDAGIYRNSVEVN